MPAADRVAARAMRAHTRSEMTRRLLNLGDAPAPARSPAVSAPGCVDAARRKLRPKHGGGRVRGGDAEDLVAPERPEALLALDEALGRLAAANPQAAELVKLRHFAGLTNAEAADALGISPRKANQVWAYARAWLRDELVDEVDGGRP